MIIKPRAKYDLEKGKNLSALILIARYNEVYTIIISARILINNFKLLIGKIIENLLYSSFVAF